MKAFFSLLLTLSMLLTLTNVVTCVDKTPEHVTTVCGKTYAVTLAHADLTLAKVAVENEGRTMVNGQEGCTEAAVMMGSSVSAFLQVAKEQGIVYNPTLVAVGAEHGVETIPYSEDALEPGDVIFFGTEDSPLEHAMLYIGGGIMAGNNSYLYGKEGKGGIWIINVRDYTHYAPRLILKSGKGTDTDAADFDNGSEVVDEVYSEWKETMNVVDDHVSGAIAALAIVIAGLSLSLRRKETAGTVETADTVETVETVETVKSVDTVELVETIDTIFDIPVDSEAEQATTEISVAITEGSVDITPVTDDEVELVQDLTEDVVVTMKGGDPMNNLYTAFREVRDKYFLRTLPWACAIAALTHCVGIPDYVHLCADVLSPVNPLCRYTRLVVPLLPTEISLHIIVLGDDLL